MKWLSVFVFVVGASHSFLSLIVGTVALSMPPPTSISQQAQHERKMGMGNLPMLPMLLTSWERSDKMKDKMEFEAKANREEKDKVYDFIVVGSGTAGSIVASRLSEHYSVLLLEAGGNPHINHDNPAMSMIMSKHPETDWMYSSIKQDDSCLMCPEKKYTFSAGKGLGGSANLNYLDTLYEGSFEDYNEWMEATQDPSWGLFMLQDHIRTVKDFLKKKYSVPAGESSYYRSTYKALVKTTPMLEISKYSHVNRVIIDEDGRATGVEYQKFGNAKIVNASKEVILSAGTFGSPKILLLSGIGPIDVLNRYNITLQADLFVGKNFQDHLAIPLGPFFKSNEKGSDDKNDSLSKSNSSWNSTTVLRMPLVNLNYHTYSKEMAHFLGIEEPILKEYMQGSLPKSKNASTPSSNSMFVNIALRKPQSRGEVSISGSDPKLKPTINPNFLSEMSQTTFDMDYSSEKKILIDALEETIKLMEVNPTYKATFTDIPFPGCENFIFRGYGYWDCYIKHFSISLNHGVGTCPMGSSKSSIPAVVNPELKVIGIQGLRVVDASVMPTLIGTFPYQSVAIIGEKGADMIIKEYMFAQYRRPRSDSGANQNQNQLDTKVDKQDSPNTNSFQLFSGFRINTLSNPNVNTTSRSIATTLSQLSNIWKETGQMFQRAYTHNVGTSLYEDDLKTPGEEPGEKPNPSHFPVMPLAGKLIFHPLVPQESTLVGKNYETRDKSDPNLSLTNLFKNLLSPLQALSQLSQFRVST